MIQEKYPSNEGEQHVGRVVYAFADHDPNTSLPNVVITGRYNVLTFFPQNLFEQFRRLANVYFLVLGIIAAVGEYTNYYETAVQAVGILTPVSAVVLISMIKDGVEDLKRHRTDAIVNARPVQALSVSNQGSSSDETPIATVQWKDLFPGDVLVLRNGDEVPADCVVLACGGIQGSVCYVETAAIDGESNLKPRNPCITIERTAAVPGTVQNANLIEMSANGHSVRGLNCLRSVSVNIEEPNEVIDCFNGSVSFCQSSTVDGSHDGKDRKELTLTKEHLLLRGCVLRASEWAVALVVYTGPETKLSLNSKKPPSKLSSVDRIVNRTLIIAMSCMVCVCVISMLCELGWLTFNGQADYLCIHSTSMQSEYVGGGGCNSSMPNSALTFFTFATLYNNFVCISMYVSLEMVYLCQAYFISQDLALYDATTDTPAECHSTGMCADLGQVQFVLSDKTGTLTKNVMKLRRVSVTGRKYGAPIMLGGLIPATAPPPDTQSVPRRSSAFVRADRAESRKSAHHGGGAPISQGQATPGNPEFDYGLFRTSEGEIWLPLHELETHSSVAASLAMASSSEQEDEGYLAELGRDAIQISDFLRVLVACNSVILMPEEGGAVAVSSYAELMRRLQAESPDEVALVSAAGEYGGRLLVQRKEDNVRYTCTDSEAELTILAINAFDSDRKRMSVLVRTSDGRYVLLLKGADSSVLPLCGDSRYRTECETHIDTFASTGLRTLVMAQKELSEAEASEWLKQYKMASKLIVGRSEQLRHCAILIEHSLDLLGAVGIEDELQDGVPQAISTLLEMGLNVWMITGDKAETAIAISQQCDLLSESHFMEKLLGLTGEALRQRLLDLVAHFENRRRDLSVSDDCFSLSIAGYEETESRHSQPHAHGHGPASLRPSGATGRDTYGQSSSTMTPSLFSASSLRPSDATHRPTHHSHAPGFGKTALSFVQPLLASAHGASSNGNGNTSDERGPSPEAKKLALIVDGVTLEAVWAVDDVKLLFTRLVQHIPTVIACRVSPKQKAALVSMIKSGAGSPITLAVGDGANDVGMIHEARVGVGIAGREGRHAANSSDFAIGQFRFLVPLMLEHGRYNYIRCCKLVLYSFFKNLLLVSVLFYFCVYSGFSGTVPLDSIIFSGYNFYLGLPIIALGAMDRDVPPEGLRRHPQLAYRTGRCAELLNLRNMAGWCMMAFVQGYLLFAIGIRMVSGSHTSIGEGFAVNIDGPGLNNASGQNTGLFEVGYLLYSCIFLSMQNKVMLMTTTRTYIHWTLWWLSTLGFFSFTWVYGVSPSMDWYNVVPLAFSCGIYWLSILLIPVVLLMAELVTSAVSGLLFPSSADSLKELLRHTPLYVPDKSPSQQRAPQLSRLNAKVDTPAPPSSSPNTLRRVGFKTSDVGERESDRANKSSGNSVGNEKLPVQETLNPVHPSQERDSIERASFGMPSSSFDGGDPSL